MSVELNGTLFQNAWPVQLTQIRFLYETTFPLKTLRSGEEQDEERLLEYATQLAEKALYYERIWVRKESEGEIIYTFQMKPKSAAALGMLKRRKKLVQEEYAKYPRQKIIRSSITDLVMPW